MAPNFLEVFFGFVNGAVLNAPVRIALMKDDIKEAMGNRPSFYRRIE